MNVFAVSYTTKVFPRSRFISYFEQIVMFIAVSFTMCHTIEVKVRVEAETGKLIHDAFRKLALSLNFE